MPKKVALYIRVSTERQAAVDEGSLKSQEQRLEEYVRYTNTVDDADLEIYDRYIDVESGGTVHRTEYQRMLGDIRKGSIQVVAAASISRLNRSLVDFYDLHELCESHGVDIISLKEKFDTTSAMGRAMLKFMLVFYELEREQTGERVSDNYLARKRRGLWNGSQIFGYLPGENKGHLVPDPIHANTVKLIFDLYEAKGSISAVRDELRKRGLKTREYVTKKGHVREAKNFSDETIRRIIKNHAYIGKNEINKSNKYKDNNNLPEQKRYAIVEGVWEGIIENDQFNRVQVLIIDNNSANRSLVTSKKKTYLLAGIILCGECGSATESVKMDPISGTSATGRTYFYYKCSDCRSSVNATEVEKVVFEQLSSLSKNDKLQKEVMHKAKKVKDAELPKLKAELARLESERNEHLSRFNSLVDLNNLADKVQVKEMLNGQADSIATKIAELNTHIADQKSKIEKKSGDQISIEIIKEALQDLDSLLEEVTPYQKQKLMQYLIKEVKVYEERLELSILGEPTAILNKKGRNLSSLRPLASGPDETRTRNFLRDRQVL
jgi:site-specific DNA recombinase